MGMDISDVAIPVTHFTLFEFTVCWIMDKRKNIFASLLALDVHQKSVYLVGKRLHNSRADSN